MGEKEATITFREEQAHRLRALLRWEDEEITGERYHELRETMHTNNEFQELDKRIEEDPYYQLGVEYPEEPAQPKELLDKFDGRFFTGTCDDMLSLRMFITVSFTTMYLDDEDYKWPDFLTQEFSAYINGKVREGVVETTNLTLKEVRCAWQEARISQSDSNAIEKQ